MHDRRPDMKPAHVLSLATALLVAALAAATPALAVPPAWRAVTQPWPTAPASDLAAFAPSGLAAAGPNGLAAVSGDGGVTWLSRAPALQGITADLKGIAFRDADHGVVVGAAGTLLVTSDGGVTWRTTGISGRPPSGTLRDVALAGMAGCAVGDGGALLRTSDGGETWRVLDSPTTEDLRAVAVAGDGTIVAGGGGGVVICGSGDGLDVVAQTEAPVTAVAAAASPVWGDGTADLVASGGNDVLASDDGATFAPLIAAPWYGITAWPAVTWLGVPGAGVLLAGEAGGAGFYWLADGAWQTSRTGLAGNARVATAPGGQSVAYVLDVRGRAVRTLSAGRTAAPQRLSKRTITAGAASDLTATVNIGAPGTLILERRVVGSTWKDQELRTWTAGGWGSALVFPLRPLLTTDYRLRFAYGGTRTVVGATVRVTVRPRLSPDKLKIAVSRGGVYRFAGNVYPGLRGEKVQLYTDRQGGWHRLKLGADVRLTSDGKRWVSRAFGAPVRESYHLRAFVAKTARHAGAWSPVVTVVVK
jgi:photosystem II stability/assembly factor-like uncharacterized protein